MNHTVFTRAELQSIKYWLSSGASKESIFFHMKQMTDEIYDALTVDKICELLDTSKENDIFVPYRKKK